MKEADTPPRKPSALDETISKSCKLKARIHTAVSSASNIISLITSTPE